MGWLILVIICIILLTVLLNLYHRKKAVKPDTAAPIADEHVEDVLLTAVDQTEQLNEDLQETVKRQPRTYQPPTTFRPPTERHKSYVRYNWQEIFEDSIVSPFPEDFLSPALPYLQEANRLERAGAAPILVEQALTKAHELDAKAAELYLTRWSIMKTRQKQKD